MTQNPEQPGYQKTSTEVPTPNAHELRGMVHPERKGDKSVSRAKQMGVMGVILATIGAAGFGGMKYAESKANNSPEPSPEPTVSAPVVPGEATPTPTETTPVEEEPSADPTNTEVENPGEMDREALIESLKIPVGLSPTETAEAYMSLSNKWLMADATEEEIDKTIQDFYEYNSDGSADLDGFIEQKALENADIYSEALFIKGWENSPNLVKVYNHLVYGNQQNIATNMKNRTDGMDLFYLENTISNAQDSSVDSNNLTSFSFDLTQEFINSSNERTVEGFVNLDFDTSTGKSLLSNHSSVTKN